MKIKINGCKWKIKECSGNEMPLADGTFYGRTYYIEKRIYLNDALALDQKIKTLRHELAHVFRNETQIFSPNEVTWTEEMLCEFVGHYGGQIEEIVQEYVKRVK